MEGHKKLKPIRIAFCHSGEVLFDDVRMEKFMKQNAEALTLPVAILSIIGDPKSGKSFLLNVFLHYLKSKGGGGWVTQFAKEGWRGEGFRVSWDLNAKKEGFESGIYMWPELLPWIDERDGIQKGSILLLDLEISQDEGKIRNNGLLERLCSFWSSMIVDNRKNQFKPNFLETLLDMKSFVQTDTKQIQRLLKRSTPPALCDHFIFVVRDFDSSGARKLRNPEEHAERMIATSPRLDCIIFKSLTEDKEKFSFFLLKNPEQMEIDPNSVLKMGTQFTNKLNSLTTGIFQRVEWKDIHHAEGGLLTFFGNGVEIVNLYNRRVNSRELQDEVSEISDLSYEAKRVTQTWNTTLDREILKQLTEFSEAPKTVNLYPSHHPDSSTPASPLKHGRIYESELREQFKNDDGFVRVKPMMSEDTPSSQPQPQCSVSVQFPTPKPESSTLSQPPTMAEENGKASQHQSVIDVSKQKETGVTCHHHHSTATPSVSTASTPVSLDPEMWQELKPKLARQMQGEIEGLKSEHKAALERCPVSEIDETNAKQCPILIGKLEHYLSELASSVASREDVDKDVINHQIEESLKILKINLEVQKKLILSKRSKPNCVGNNSILPPPTKPDDGDTNRKDSGNDVEQSTSSDVVTSHANVLEQKGPSSSQVRRNDQISTVLMTENMTGKFLAPDRRRKIRQTGKQAALDGFKKSCDFKANEGLDSKFTGELINFETKNEMAGGKAMAEANMLVHGQRKNYNTQMDDFLPKKGPSRSDQELEQKHKELLAEACKLLTVEITKADAVIGSQPYEATLRDQIQMDWIEIKKLNQKIATQEKREKNKNEAEKVERKKSSCGMKGKKSSSSTSRNSHQANPSSEMQWSFDASKIGELPPLPIEFECNHFRVGWVNDEKQFCIGHQVTPRIQITQEGDILIGDEVQEGREKIVDVWEIFMDMNIPKTTEIYVSGRMHILEHEVILALFLGRVKKSVEQTLNGKWNRLVMTVPLCFTSTQRRAIKDSTILAGFSNCILLNETGAAALYIANEELYKNNCGHCVAIGISGKGYYDFALYSYGRGQVEMMGSCGNRHSSLTTNQGTSTFSKVGDTVGKIITILGAAFQQQQDENENGKFHEMMMNIINPAKGRINVAIHIYHVKHKGINFASGDGKIMARMEAHFSVLYGAAIFASTLATGGEEFAKDSIKDKVSYVFARAAKPENEMKKATKYLFSDIYPVLKPCGLQETTTLGIPSESSNHWVIQEESSNFSSYVGCIKVAPCDAEVSIKCHLSWDGIFDISNVISLPERQKVDIEWNTHNLNHSEIPKLQEFVRSMDKDKCKQQLLELVNHVETLVSKSNNIEFIARMMFAKAIEEAKTQLNDPNTTMDMFTGKIELLEGLKNQYIK